MVLCVPADYVSALGINRLLTYLEAPADAVVRPWVWIAMLFLGAALGAVLNEGLSVSGPRILHDFLLTP